ncbi:MAG: Asp-tRNA(Asn)/Glu-tRNA(Gln) amidotransferase subunit GatB [Candidatus Sericytochromatia bacterium]|nr:Asp-tRNA(Asn)/Glu-tRNA(Gln) amidotransferase subunit GatB [Candidatus Sericytochromatia bacterium]
MQYEAVIGLEVHAELLTNTKIFSSVPAKFGGEPNTNVNEICLGMPGTLPVLNEKVVDLALRACRALEFTIPSECTFDRKNYFYPDLPKGYQITQFDKPIGLKGQLEVNFNGIKKVINITRIHIEEDAGKLVHAGSDRLQGSSYSLADYNRAGVPLVEIVSEPEIRSSEEAKAYFEELRNVLVYTGVCDGKMQEGSMRCDANISIRPIGTEKFGTRVEIKNLNSFKSLQRAIDYEIERQTEALQYGDKIVQETRLWDENKGVTNTMRVKEDADDYRYFPDPDLVSVIIDDAWLKKIDQELPELPKEKRARYIQDYGLSEYDSSVLVNSLEMVKFFEDTVILKINPKLLTNWLTGSITTYLNETGKALNNTKLTPELLHEMIQMIENGTISNKIAKDILNEVMETGDSPVSIVEKKGVTQISNTDEIMAIIKKIVENNPKQVEEFLAGKVKVLGFFVGQIMKATQGRANPDIVNSLLITEINNHKK